MKESVRSIAKEAGVSAATVSRVLSGKVDRGSRTYLKVMRLVEDFGYKKKRKIKTNGTILCLTRKLDMQTLHSYGLQEKLSQVAQREGFDFIMIPGDDSNSFHTISKNMKIVGAISLDSHFAEPANFPIIHVNTYSTEGYNVNCDDLSGYVKLAKYLKKMGHKQIAFFNLYREKRRFQHPKNYFIEKVCDLANIEYRIDYVFQKAISLGTHTEFIEEWTKHYLKMTHKPTALMIFGDSYVSDFYKILKKNKIFVPENISITGFDDIPSSKLLTPSLTTVQKPLFELAEVAIKTFKSKLMDPVSSATRILVEPELIIRTSVKSLKD